MKKRLNTAAIANDLHGASLFFTDRAATPPPQTGRMPRTVRSVRTGVDTTISLRYT
jgi:hypothetical protein